MPLTFSTTPLPGRVLAKAKDTPVFVPRGTRRGTERFTRCERVRRREGEGLSRCDWQLPTAFNPSCHRMSKIVSLFACDMRDIAPRGTSRRMHECATSEAIDVARNVSLYDSTKHTNGHEEDFRATWRNRLSVFCRTTLACGDSGWSLVVSCQGQRTMTAATSATGPKTVARVARFYAL